MAAGHTRRGRAGGSRVRRRSAPALPGLLPLLLVGALLPGQARAGGASAVEQGTARNGVASAGQAASASDATTAFFNPAGMTRLDRPQFALGTQFVKSKVVFDPDDATRAALGNNDGGDAGGYAYGLSAFYVRDLTDDWKLGASLTTPVAGGLDYDDQWVGRYFVTDVTSVALLLNPVVAYRVDDRLSLGAGVQVGYMTMDFDLRLPSDPGFPDGKLELEDMDDWALGWNLGLLFEPVAQARIGIHYRSKLEFDLGGHSRPSRLAPPFLGLLDDSVSSEFSIPQTVVLSAYQQVAPALALLLDVQWTDWSAFDDTPIDVGALPQLAIPRRWQDTWRYAIGMEYRAAPRWLLQFGFSYDSSPTDSRRKRLPDLPIDRIFKYTVGFLYDWSEDLTLGASFMYVDLGRGSARLDYTQPSVPRVSGEYERNDAVVLSFHLNWKTGD